MSLTALVVDDANKGQRLVFRYPALREASEADAGGAGGVTAGARGAGSSSSSSSASSLGPPPPPSSSSSSRPAASKDAGGSSDAWAIQQCDAEFHQLRYTTQVCGNMHGPNSTRLLIRSIRHLHSPEVFARLFRPKAQLCGRVRALNNNNP